MHRIQTKSRPLAVPRRRIRPALAWALLVTVCMASGARADDEAPGTGGTEREASELELRTERVVVFKDGHGLFVRKGSAMPDANGDVWTYDVPDDAVLGTFWAFSEDSELLGMHAERIEHQPAAAEEAPCAGLYELLKANEGQSLTLTVHIAGEEREVSGVLEAVQGDTLAVSAQTALVVLTGTPRGKEVFPFMAVRAVTGSEDLRTSWRRPTPKQMRKRLRLRVTDGSTDGPVSVTLLYFRPGIRWIPTYRVSGELETDAEISLQGELMNGVEELSGTELGLVVGVPNFRFKDTPSPLTLEHALRGAMPRRAQQLMAQNMLSNASFGSRAGERMDSPPGSVAELAPDLATSASQDLFVYQVGALDMQKGDSLTVPLWQSKVPLRHVYTVDVALGRDARQGGGYKMQQSARAPQTSSPVSLTRAHVWHQLELQNNTAVPWTTGAALTMNGTLPLGQDLLTYTPVGSRVLLPLTVAVDLRADFDEVELSRAPDAVRWDGNRYARVHKKATLEVMNFKREPAHMRVTLSTGGKALEASHEGVIRLNDYRPADWENGSYHFRLNNHSDIEWEFELAPGESRELTVEFEFFIR